MSSINNQLVAYIKDALRQGHDINSIKLFLLQNNVSANDINQAITSLQQPDQASFESQLRTYINASLQRGYDREMIRQALISQGYQAQLIDRMLKEILKENAVNIHVRHEVHLSSATIAMVLISFVIIGGVAYMFLFRQQGQQVPLLDASLELGKESYSAADMLEYKITLSNMGSSERFDARVRYSVEDSSGSEKKGKSETIAVSTRAASTGRISLAGLGPGTYTLKARVAYGGEKEAESSVGFSIAASEQQTHEDNPENPSGEYTYCDQIKSVDARDNCYLEFVVKGDAEMCPKINDTKIRQYCEQAKILSDIDKYYRLGNMTKVEELTKKFNASAYDQTITPKTIIS